MDELFGEAFERQKEYPTNAILLNPPFTKTFLNVSIGIIRYLARELLFEHFKRLSKKYLGKEEIPDFDLKLWRALQEGPEVLKEEEIEHVEMLHELSGGWWHLKGNIWQFVPTEMWKEYYESKKETTEDKWE